MLTSEPATHISVSLCLLHQRVQHLQTTDIPPGTYHNASTSILSERWPRNKDGWRLLKREILKKVKEKRENLGSLGKMRRTSSLYLVGSCNVFQEVHLALMVLILLLFYSRTYSIKEQKTFDINLVLALRLKWL